MAGPEVCHKNDEPPPPQIGDLEDPRDKGPDARKEPQRLSGGERRRLDRRIRRRLKNGPWPAHFDEMMGDVLLLPGHQCGIEGGIDREVSFPADQPGGRVVRAHHEGESERGRMNAELQSFAIAAVEKG
jgi:hypothetical protein